MHELVKPVTVWKNKKDKYMQHDEQDSSLLLEKIEGSFEVKNEKGMHTRPCTELVKSALKFRSKIYLVFDGHQVNAKSLLGVLTLAAIKGSTVKIVAVGDDAKEAVTELESLAESSFNASY